MKSIAIALALILAGVFVLLIFSVFVRNSHFTATELPPGETLNAFLEQHPNPIAIYKFKVNGSTFVFVQGTYPPGDWGIPSGPPAYIFDETGSLADWADDNNEGRPFAPYWKSDHSKGGVPENAVRITTEEAKQLVRSH